ncbi:hypothetical protein V6N11_020070 [Hibiscus sabdariffa]|uniref:RNase H type-1 domain-containing protein n=1 Tax=Hibiscus sabdariffa TaxID=183260 RepID=A0ABR2P8J0_9ROSI
MIFFSIVWTLWLSRNEAVFRNVSIEVDHMFQLSLLRVCRWGSAKWAPLFPLLSTILARSEALESVSLVRPLLSPSLWFPPEAEALKFDIDGAVSGSFGPAGIGGVLRNHEGKMLCYFSKNVGVIDAPTAELLVIKEAGILFKSSKWARSHHLFVECDSNNVVHWIRMLIFLQLRLEESSSAFWPRVEGLDWQVFLIARVQNTLAADNLAKKGISISRDIAEFLLD